MTASPSFSKSWRRFNARSTSKSNSWRRVKKHQNMKTRPDEVREAALAIDVLRAELDVRLRELQELAGLSDPANCKHPGASGRWPGCIAVPRFSTVAAHGEQKALSPGPHRFRSMPFHLVAGVRIDHATPEFALTGLRGCSWSARTSWRARRSSITMQGQPF